MNRFKFRAWQPQPSFMRKPGMYKVSTLDFYDGDGGGEATLIGESRQSSAFFDDIVLMQCTGMKDRNGYDIFEGDLLMDTDSMFPDTVYEVIFDNGGFTVKNTDSQSSKPASNDWLRVFSKDCTLVGNIYEKPDLLK